MENTSGSIFRTGNGASVSSNDGTPSLPARAGHDAMKQVLIHDPQNRHWMQFTRYEKARASCPDSDDVLLYNEKGEVTESCIANVVILRKGRWVTPPVR